jgi:hypothetical protein
MAAGCAGKEGMEMDRIINQIVRQVTNRLLNRGIDAGVDRLSRGTGGGQASPEQQAQSRNTAKHAKQALRLARRLGRF